MYLETQALERPGAGTGFLTFFKKQHKAIRDKMESDNDIDTKNLGVHNYIESYFVPEVILSFKLT